MFIRFPIVCPTLHYVCAELQWLIAYFKSNVLAHMNRLNQTNENILIVWLQFHKRRLQFRYSYSQISRHILPWFRCCAIHCICSQTKAHIHSDNTHRLAVFAHFSKRQDSICPNDCLLLSLSLAAKSNSTRVQDIIIAHLFIYPRNLLTETRSRPTFMPVC